MRTLDDYRLTKSKKARIEKGESIGIDGHKLLDVVRSEDARAGCARSRRWRPCGECGSKTSSEREFCKQGFAYLPAVVKVRCGRPQPPTSGGRHVPTTLSVRLL